MTMADDAAARGADDGEALDAQRGRARQRVRHFLVRPVGRGIGIGRSAAAAEIQARHAARCAPAAARSVSKSLALRVRPGRQTTGVRPQSRGP